MTKLPISALVASYNEGHLLEDCLKSIQFCDEIYFVNLGSTDNSVEIAKKYATTVEEFKKVPRIEDVHPLFIPKLKYDWFILIDPDERIMPALAEDIKTTLETAPPELAVIRVPMFNYFKGKKLKGTVYGGVVYARLLYKKQGVAIDDEVHAGIKMKEGFSRKKILFTEENYDKHFWCNSWKQLFDKHKRYLQGEGKAQYNADKRYSLKKQWHDSIIRFYYSFKTREGYKDGLTGFLLSLMAARYEFLSWRSLRRYEKEINS